MLPSIMVVTLKFLISSEKSLQVQLDYCVIINHIQRHEKHILFTYLRAPKKTRRTREECAALWLRWAAHLHNIWFEQASGEWFCFRSGGGTRSVHFSLRLNSDQSVLFHLVCFLQAESPIWQVVFLLRTKLLSMTLIPFGLDEYSTTITHKGRKSQSAPSHEPREADLLSQVKLEMCLMCTPANPCANLD